MSGTPERESKRPVWRRGFLGFLARAYHRLRWTTLRNAPDDQVVWRAVCRASQLKSGTTELKPGFFRDRRGLSCDFAILTTQRRALRGVGWPPGTGLREFRVSSVRALGADVVHDPTTSPKRNYAHCIVDRPLTGSEQKKMIKDSHYAVTPDRVRLDELKQN